MGLMRESYVWIVTDDIVSRSYILKYKKSFPSYYRGILGIIPTFKGPDDATMNEYIWGDAGDRSDFRLSSVKIASGISIIIKIIDSNNVTMAIGTPNISCNASNIVWDQGDYLFTKLKERYHFDGFPDSTHNSTSNPEYDIVNFKNNDFEVVGKWDYGATSQLTDEVGDVVKWTSRSDLVYMGGGRSPPTGYENSLSGYHLKIGIVQEPPIAFLKESCVNDTSKPQCWYGWNPEIFEEFAERLNFTYEYVVPSDNKFGGFNKKTNSWNGLMKDLLDRKIDVTIALSINSERTKVIQYTTPFYEDQASFIVQENLSHGSSNTFFFLAPFHTSVWIAIICLIIILAVIMTILNKYSPFGYHKSRVRAVQSCVCKTCKSTISRLLSPMQTFEPECLVSRLEDQHNSSELSLYDSTWLIGTGLHLIFFFISKM